MECRILGVDFELKFQSHTSGCRTAGFAVITGLSYPSRVAIQGLQELYKDFMEKYGSDAKTAAENALSKNAKSIFKDNC